MPHHRMGRPYELAARATSTNWQTGNTSTASSPTSRRDTVPARSERGRHPADLRQEERARVHARVAAEGLPALADDEGADVGQRPLPADRLPGDHLLLRAQDRRPRPKSLDEVDPKLLETYEKLGIPLRERELLAGVAVDAVFDSVSVATTFKEKLAELGIIFCSFSEAVQNHPDLVQQVPRLGGALHGQLLRRAELGGVHATAPSATSPRACAARWSSPPTSASTRLRPGSSSGR